MNKLIINIFLILLVIYLVFSNTRESFSNNKIKLLVKNGKVKAQFNHINSYLTLNNKYKSKGVILDGKQGNIVIPNLNMSEFTIKFYFKPFNSKKKQVLLYLNDGNHFIEISNNELNFSNKSSIMVSRKKIDENKLHFLALSINREKIKIHVNGRENHYDNNDNIILNRVTIGKAPNNKMNFNGLVGKINVSKLFETHSFICNYSDLCESFKPVITDSNTQSGVLDKSCKFVPHGQLLKNCIEKCKSTNNCDTTYCNEICNSCSDSDACMWLPKIEEKDIQEDVNNTIEDKSPGSMKIKAIPLDEKVLLQWKLKNQGSSPIINYIIIVKESFSNSKSKRISLHKDPTCKNCEYEVTGLKNQVYYDISIRAVNNHGIGNISNIETVAPIGERRNSDVSDSLLESDLEIAKLVSKERGYENTSCGRAANSINDNHILNKEYINLYDNIKKVYS